MPERKLKKYVYESNNSGGDWWISDDNWKDLEKAGWTVEWVKDNPNYFSSAVRESGRWLGALATRATKEFYSRPEAIDEFEEITGLCYDTVGCPCCGSPHYIYED